MSLVGVPAFRYCSSLAMCSAKLFCRAPDRSLESALPAPKRLTPEIRTGSLPASPLKGRQPLWPEAIQRNYIRPAAERAKITKHISWHVFRRTFSTLLAENDEDVKTVQSADAPRQQQHHHEYLHSHCKQQEAESPEQSGGNDFAGTHTGGRSTGVAFGSAFLENTT